MKKFSLPPKRSALPPAKRPAESEPEITNMMLDPRYLRQSSALIQDALQKGFDVLQLSNGDIVTTGTKTVVYQYKWNDETGKLFKTKPESARKMKPLKAPTTGEEEENETENESENEDS